MKLKHGTPEYWRDWYWNRGGRDKVQASRKNKPVRPIKKHIKFE
jgi:hypothetical protein